jgi:transposase-like protein
VEQALSSSLSLASLARQHGANANQLFYWRTLYCAGQLGGEIGADSPGVRLIPVSVEVEESSDPKPEQRKVQLLGLRMNIEIPAVRWSALKAPLMQRSFGPFLRVFADDPGQHADLVCGGSDRHAPRLPYRSPCEHQRRRPNSFASMRRRPSGMP